MYEVLHFDGLRCHDVRIGTIGSGMQNLIRGTCTHRHTDTHTHRKHGGRMSLLILLQNKEKYAKNQTVQNRLTC
jgi:hypothetical protein